MKTILGTIWALITIVIFYKYQTYYFDAFQNYAFIIFTILIVGFGFFLTNKFLKNKKIHFTFLIGITVLFSFIFSTYKFWDYDFATLKNITIVKEGQRLAAYPNEVPENADVLYEKDEIIADSSTIIPYFPENIQSNFEKAGISDVLVLFSKILLITLAVSILALIFLSIGFIFTENFLVAEGLGLFVTSVLAFLFTAIKIFTAKIFAPVLLVIFLISLVFSRKKILSFLKSKIEFSPVFIPTLAFFGLYLVDVIRVIPVSFDESNFYGFFAKLLSESLNFPHGIGTFAWLNLSSINWLFFNSYQGFILFSFLSAIFGFLTLNKLLNKFFEKNISQLLSLLFFSLPFLVFQEISDIKIELPLFFIGTLAVYKFIEFLESKKNSDLILFSIFLGFAFSIKITALILLASLFLGLIISLKKQSIKAIAISAGIIILCSAPWTIYNYVDSNFASIKSAIFGVQNEQTKLVSGNDFCKIETPRYDIDFERFTSPLNSVMDYLKFPFEVFVTPNLNSGFADFSFFFVAILGFIIINFKKIFSEKKYQLILILTLVYSGLWFYLGKGVIWYGIFMFLGFLLISGKAFLESKNLEKKLLYSLLILALASNFILRLTSFANPQFFANAAGLIPDTEIQNYIFPGYKETSDILSSEEHIKLYRVGTFISYFTSLNYEEFSDDNLLEYWACVENADDEIIKKQFKSKGITHILVHENTANTIDSASYKLSHQKLLDFLARSGYQSLYKDHGLWLLKTGY